MCAYHYERSKPLDPAGKTRIGVQVGHLAGEPEVALLVCLPQSADDLVLPTFFQPTVGHQKPGISSDPTIQIQTQTTSSHDQMDVRMRFQIRAKGVDDSDNPEPHTLDVAGPLLHSFDG